MYSFIILFLDWQLKTAEDGDWKQINNIYEF